MGTMVRVAIALLLLLCAPCAAQSEKRIALLIGNKDYKPGVGALVNPLNDVRIVGEALKAVGFDVLKPVQNARRSDMLLAVHDFAAKLKAAGADAVGFLYYSGHGIASAGENYLIPVDVDEPSTRLLSVQGVRQSEVLAILRTEAPNAAHYLVLDACRNTLQGTRGGKGFVPVGQQSGVLVAFAAEPGKTASDTGRGSGPYAAALAYELIKPGQTDLIMFHRVRVAVIQQTGGDQVPWTEDGIQRPERVLFGGEIKLVPVAPAHPQISEAERTWAWIRNTTDQAVLENFIKQFGDTPFGEEAKARLTELKKQQVAIAAPPPPVRPTPARPTEPPASNAPAPAPTRCEGVEALVGNERRCLKPKDTFKDCPECPEMVVVPAGEFMMGSLENEAQRRMDESAQRKVTVAASFAVGKFEVTFAEWDACVAGGACRHNPSDQSLGRGKRPVFNVSWDDVNNEYLPWLSQKTGKRYRLLTEAEWEYAARAGTTTPFSTGRTITTEQANFNSGPKGQNRRTSIEVGSLQPNAFGLYDLHGNVLEWVEDCYKDSYAGSPTDGSVGPSVSGCSRVVRGGAWASLAGDLRSANRRKEPQAVRFTILGFRVARTLSP
jgi:formylglycine-generating enzyme required for sulfatase activity